MCVCVSFLSFLLSFYSLLICLETYWDGCIAKQSCDELLIDDSFIRAPCYTRSWHFSALNLQRPDTNALMSSKRVYKLGQVGRPFPLKTTTTTKTWRPGTDRMALKVPTSAEEKVCLCVWLYVFGFAYTRLWKMYEEHSLFLSEHREREQTVPRMPGENTVQIVWGRREQIREKAVCSSGLQGNSSPDSQVRELKEK